MDKKYREILFNAGVEDKLLDKMKDEKAEALADFVNSGYDISIVYKKGLRSLSREKIYRISRLLDNGISADLAKEIAENKKLTAEMVSELWYRYPDNLYENGKLVGKYEDDKMRKVINGLLEREEKHKARPLDKKQQNEIDRMKKLGVDTTPYEKNTIKPGILREIRLCFENGVDPDQIYRKGHKLRQWQCTQVRQAMEAGLTGDILNKINNKELLPMDMAARRLWYSDVPKEMQEYVEQHFEDKYDDKMYCNILRRALMIPTVQKSEKIRNALFADFRIRNDFSEYCCDDEAGMIMKMTLILNMQDAINNEDKCIEMLNEFDKTYDEACKQYHECRQVMEAMDAELSSKEDADLRYDSINQFFVDNINMPLKAALEKLHEVKDKNEYNMDGNVFYSFDTDYFNNKHLTMADTCGYF